jgi:lipoprotein-releasing system ATP-binding protein
MADIQLSLDSIYKTYGTSVKTTVLKGINLQIVKGEFASVIGQSGSGKSTLLNMIGLLDRADSGTMIFNNAPVYDLDEDEMADFRNRTIGFIFQLHYLLPEFTTLENVLMPYKIAHGKADSSSRDKAAELLKRVGVGDKIYNKSTQLSGGQQQRVAIARALMNNPSVILADEPTGNLDSDSGETVYQLLREINKDNKTTFIIVTHDRHIAAKCDRVIEIADGCIVNDFKTDGQKSAETWDKLAPCYCRIKSIK